MKELLLLFVIVVIGFIACSKKVKQAVTEETTISPNEKTEQLAKSTFTNKYDITYNQSKSVACITKSFKKRPSEIFPTLSFLLYNPTSDKVIFKETIGRATGKWINDEEFEVLITPGRVGRAASLKNKQGFIYNVLNGKKRVIK